MIFGTGQDFEFTVVSLDPRGTIAERVGQRARQYVEQLEPGAAGAALELVWIPGGTFLMGSPKSQGYEDEHPQRRVMVAPFLMGKYPVTREQWECLMGESPVRFPGATRPVDNISWKAAVQFCETLAKRTGRAYHLPSEAQWEYACRAGTTTPFYFGETLTTDVANYNGEFTFRSEPKGIYRHKPTEVGLFPPNAFGLFDMHGNLWEWCADAWHDSYEGAPPDDRAWTLQGEAAYRVARGGSWHDTPEVCRSATRLRMDAGEGDEIMGFRVALSPG